MIHRFESIQSRYLEEIPGQSRFAFAHTGSSDFYDLVEYAQEGRVCPGSALLFCDYDTGAIHQPFPEKKGVLYSDPLFAEDCFWFLQADWGAKRLTLYRCLPGDPPQQVKVMDLGGMSLYNLRLMGSPAHIVSQDEERFECWYPERISFPLVPQETVLFLEDGKAYSEIWIEEGWKEEQDTEQTRLRYQLLVRGSDGTILSREDGSLHQRPDGSWWIA